MMMVNYKIYLKAVIVYANCEVNSTLDWQHPVLQHKLATSCIVDSTINQNDKNK